MKTTLTLILASLVLPLAFAQTASAKPATAKPAGTKTYPLKTCIVSGNALGSMGDEQRLVYEGQEVKFCCKPCIAKFRKDPAKYLPKLK